MSAEPFDLENPTEEHRMLRGVCRDFARKVLEPQAEHQDRVGHLDVSLMRRVGELGLLGVTIPAEHGGAGLDTVGAVIIHHELSKADPGFTLAYLAHSMLFVNNFFYAGNEAQWKKYLPKVLTGECIGAMGMTEPAAGTDVLGMKCVAVADGDDFILNGQKSMITNAPEADVFLVYAKVDGKLTSFIIERAFAGVSTPSKFAKMGMRASSLGEIVLENVRVPRENVLGNVGGGITNMMRNLEIERITLAAMSLGIADRCMEIMTSYAAERQSFGKALAEHGQIQRYIGESYAKTEAARALIYSVARSTRPAKRPLPTPSMPLVACSSPWAREKATNVNGGPLMSNRPGKDH